MRAVIQVVDKAHVVVDGKKISEIGEGFFVLLGISEKDSENDAKKLAIKISKLRVMPDNNLKMNLDLKQSGGEALIVSQFTLYGDIKDGNRPSFIKSARPEKAINLYKLFLDTLKSLGVKVKTGEFGSIMKIKSDLNGPITIIIDTKDL